MVIVEGNTKGSFRTKLTLDVVVQKYVGFFQYHEPDALD